VAGVRCNVVACVPRVTPSTATDHSHYRVLCLAFCTAVAVAVLWLMVPNEYNLKQVSMRHTGSFLLLLVACGPHVHAATTVLTHFCSCKQPCKAIKKMLQPCCFCLCRFVFTNLQLDSSRWLYSSRATQLCLQFDLKCVCC
jgi:hypothetical protein